MNSDLTTMQNTLPAELKAVFAEQVAADIERLGSTGGGRSIRVTQDKKFELPSGEMLDELTAVVIDFVYRNEYYPGVFNRKDIKPPVCFAISPVAVGMKPSPNVLMPQSNEGCAPCQWNQYGSSPTGEGKACKNTVQMALLTPDADEDTPILLLKSSPTAIRHFNAYVAQLGTKMQVPVGGVVTKIFFDPAVTYASVRFQAVAPNANFAVTNTRVAEARLALEEEPEQAQQDAPKKGK